MKCEVEFEIKSGPVDFFVNIFTVMTNCITFQVDYALISKILWPVK